jgi:hypothetical protein
MKALQKQIYNLTNAIAETGVVGSLFESLKQREEEMANLAKDFEQVEKAIQEATFRRPTASEVQQFWSQFTELWSLASEDEKSELLRCIVPEVVVHAKEKVGLKLAASADSQDHRFGITAKMGAPASHSPNHPNLSNSKVRNKREEIADAEPAPNISATEEIALIIIHDLYVPRFRRRGNRDRKTGEIKTIKRFLANELDSSMVFFANPSFLIEEPIAFLISCCK